MGKKIYALDTVYGYRTDTLANWQAENPVLYRGEPVIVSDGEDGNWLKIGDGATPFNNLPYMRGPQGPMGKKGEQGIQGKKGEQGIQGVPGENGKDADMSLISNALRGNKSGEIVSITDTSPIEHNVGVKVSGVEDLSAVSVKRYGKNLCELGTKEFKKAANCTLKHPLKAGITYQVSALIESTDTDHERCLIGFWNLETNTNACATNFQLARNDANAYTEFTPTKDVTRIDLYAALSWSEGDGDTATWKNIMIVPKGVSRNYEPFIEPTTYTPNENGIVEGVTSLYPSMTLTTDTSGVVIDAEYNRDINKAFAELQNAIINLGGTL